jgi:hypothetical protein
MGTFVLVTVDLKNGSPRDYQTVEAWLTQIFLTRSIPHGASSVRLPFNTFAGILPDAKTPAEAVAFVNKEVARLFASEQLQGKALVAASTAPEYQVLSFGD